MKNWIDSWNENRRVDMMWEKMMPNVKLTAIEKFLGSVRRFIAEHCLTEKWGFHWVNRRIDMSQTRALRKEKNSSRL
ncbi:MAG: hypothetical protein ACE5HR_00405 [bacterium]